MAHLVLFRIKNGSFPYATYGLSDNTFAIDITNSLQTSKGITFTQYPLLDGTTRIDAISKAPGTINFQGKVGDIFHAPSSNFSTLSASELETRTKRYVRLLEDLRDNAIVLDIITESKTFTNYVIETIGIGYAQFGVVDVSFSLREFIAFGSQITSINYEADSTPQATKNEFYLRTLTMDNFVTDQGLIESVYKLLTHPDVSEPYMLKLGSSDFGFTPDLTISGFLVDKPTLTVENIRGTKHRTYTPTRVQKGQYSSATYTTGKVVNDLSLRINIPTIISTGGSLVTEEEIKTQGGSYNYKPDDFNENGKYEIKIELFKEDRLVKPINTKDILITPKFSEINGGVNMLNHITNSLENDLILETKVTQIFKQALCFIRKTNDPNVYAMLPNLLGDSIYGYLYPVKYLKDFSNNRSTRYNYVIGFIYFHPELVKRLINIINTFTLTKGNLLYGKTIKWW